MDVMVDLATGATTVMGQNGRRYTLEEIAAAELAAERGDADAAATLAAVHRDEPASSDEARRMLAEAMHDCPLCQEARARGEVPVFGSSDEELDALIAQLAQPDANWWHGRRAKKRGRR